MNHRNRRALRQFPNIRGMGEAMTVFTGLTVIYIVFGVINPTTFPGQNVTNLSRSVLEYSTISIGQSYMLITGDIDLFVGSIMGMSTVITVTLVTHGVNPMAAILITLVCCLAIGVVNGILVGKFQLPPFITTPGTMFAARDMAYAIDENRSTNAISSGIGKEAVDRFQALFYYGKTAGVFSTFWTVLVLFVAFFFLFSKTRTGRHIYAIGSNAEAVKLSGVSVMATVTKTYLVSVSCSSVVGLILYGQANMDSMKADNMCEMCAAAADAIGGISPLGGTGALLGTLAGAVIWQTLENEPNMIGVQVGVQRLATSIVAVFVMPLDMVLRKGMLIRKRPAVGKKV